MGAGLATGLTHAGVRPLLLPAGHTLIAGAGVLELPKLIHGGAETGINLAEAIIGGIVAAITAYASTVFLMRFFKRHDFQALNPFAYYCLAAGLLALAVPQWRDLTAGRNMRS